MGLIPLHLAGGSVFFQGSTLIHILIAGKAQLTTHAIHTIHNCTLNGLRTPACA